MNTRLLSAGIILWGLLLFGPAGAIEKATTAGEDRSTTLVMGWESWEPYTYMDGHGRLAGLEIELVTAALQKAGYTFQYFEAPFKRVLIEVEAGTVHLVSSVIKTAERASFAYFSDALYKESFVLFVRKGEKARYASIRSLDDIQRSNFQLGVMRGYSYGATFDELVKNELFSSHLEEVTTDSQNHKKLLFGRIDGFIQEMSTISFTNKDTKILDQVEPLITVVEIPLYVIFSRKATSPQVVEDFNAGLAEIRANGIYDALFKKYNLRQ